MTQIDDVKKYIAFRYKNWMDYARHMARVNEFTGWEADLLNDVIIDLLSKPEQKLYDMMSRETKKIVNGAPTTELDKFVLKMLHLNACSPMAPFRKNTLGHKIITRAGNRVEVQQRVKLNGYDTIDENYDPDLNKKLDQMHARNIRLMRQGGYTADAVELYEKHFMRGLPVPPGRTAVILKIQNYLIRND